MYMNVYFIYIKIKRVKQVNKNQVRDFRIGLEGMLGITQAPLWRKTFKLSMAPATSKVQDQYEFFSQWMYGTIVICNTLNTFMNKLVVLSTMVYIMLPDKTWNHS